MIKIRLAEKKSATLTWPPNVTGVKVSATEYATKREQAKRVIEKNLSVKSKKPR
jgi:hypothetical protein